MRTLLWFVILATAEAQTSPVLTQADVQAVVQAAASAVNTDTLTVAVSDRQGNVLAVFRQPNAAATAIGNFNQPVDSIELAVALARTAAFFSNNQAPLSSRTVRFLSGIHFPPGIARTGNAPLYGIENTNRGCPFNAAFHEGGALPPAAALDGTSAGLGIITGKKDNFDSDFTAVNPGGVPLFKNGAVVGGVGVSGGSAPVVEFAAFSGAVGGGLGPVAAPPGVILLGGIALPFVNQTSQPRGTTAGSAAGTFTVGPLDSPGPAPEGYLVGPLDGAPGGLTAAEVDSVVRDSIQEANRTRAAIRLPLGSRAQFVISVADLNGALLALYRMPDATVFSADVAVAKSRNVIYFSGLSRDPADLAGVPAGTALTNRTIGFGAQPFYPPGIDSTAPGPFFALYNWDLNHPCTQGFQPSNPNQNGVVFFPGSAPLYRGETMVGGLGISGDGVDQDDFVTAAGAARFPAPDASRADQIQLGGQRLPYWKFPRNPRL